MNIKITNNGDHRMISVDYPHHINKNGEYFGQRCYVADEVEKIKSDIANGVYTVATDDGSLVTENFDYESAYNELAEVIDHE